MIWVLDIIKEKWKALPTDTTITAAPAATSTTITTTATTTTDITAATIHVYTT